jgi:hypothetical protein
MRLKNDDYAFYKTLEGTNSQNSGASVSIPEPQNVAERSSHQQRAGEELDSHPFRYGSKRARHHLGMEGVRGSCHQKFVP